jgi:hypothetical protein
MHQAYSIPLTDADFIALGKLTAIIGQIDEEMVQTVCRILKIKREVGNAIMGSTKTATNGTIWKYLIEHATDDLDLRWLAKHAFDEMGAVSKGRNDFIHAAFYEALETGGYIYSTSNEYVELPPESSEMTRAHRVRIGARTPISELPSLIERAARLSCLVAHLAWTIVNPHPGRGDGRSPWLDRLGPTLPPRPQNWQLQTAT